MIVLPGYGERIPEQKIQAERCCVKAIRWFCSSGGCYGHNDPFFPRVIMRRSRPSVVALLSNGNHQSSWFRSKIRTRTKKKTWTARFIKFQRCHRRSAVLEDKTACRSRCSHHPYLHQGLSSTQQHQWPCTVPSLRKRGSLPELDACALIPHRALMKAVQQSA